MYMETSGIKANSRTRMASIKMRALPGGSCKMRMFYHMYGRHVKDLMVYVRREGTTTLITKYTATGNLGDMWRKAVIDLSTETNLFTVVIEGEFVSEIPL